jgi:hypothetical protein
LTENVEADDGVSTDNNGTDAFDVNSLDAFTETQGKSTNVKV